MADLSPSHYQGIQAIALLRSEASSRGDNASNISDDEPPKEPDETNLTDEHPADSRGVISRLYVSHFLSTWNSRVFEFGAVLYLATIFPGTLMPMSIYAVSRGLAAVLLSPLIGNYIDVGYRLQVVHLSIVLQRLVVALSCGIMWLMLRHDRIRTSIRYVLLGCLAFLACIEKLCSVMNLVSVEKDWVVVIAGQNKSLLRRPFLISTFDGISTVLAIKVNLGMNLASVLLEYLAIEKVYTEIPILHLPKQPGGTSRSSGRDLSIRHNVKHLREASIHSMQEVGFYLKHSAFLPSVSGALLYLTVLSFGGQMVTHLLSSGYTPIQVAIARTISVLFEISTTWMAPAVMTRIGPVRSGIWFINSQMICLAGGVAIFWTFKSPPVAASGLVIGTILSRIGLWGFDLSVQMIVQDEVDAKHRGSFSAIEASFQNAFELLSYASTVYFSHPNEFRWPVLISVVAVYFSGGMYATFVRSRRGHLVHWSQCLKSSARKGSSFEPTYQRLSLRRDF